MRLLAALGVTVLAGGIVLLIWFMFDVGFAWISWVAIGGALLLVLVFVRRVLTGTGASN